jgi:hypothetical protein
VPFGPLVERQKATHAGAVTLCLCSISLYSTMCLIYLRCLSSAQHILYLRLYIACTRLCVLYACIVRRPLSISYASIRIACTQPCVLYACVVCHPSRTRAFVRRTALMFKRSSETSYTPTSKKKYWFLEES